MPELPDIAVYVEALRRRILGRAIEEVRIGHPFILRTATPPVAVLRGRPVERIERIGKRIAIGVGDGYWLAIHLMIAGRLHWRERGAKLQRKYGLAALDFVDGAVVLTEAGTKRRAALHVVQGKDALAALDAGGIEPLASDRVAFAAALMRESHTLKRALTDPGIFAGIGNAYSDEILHAARLSPVKLSRSLTDEELTRLHTAAQTVLADWTRRLLAEAGDSFPAKVTAFRPGMAVHGRFRAPCPVCATPVQRIVHGEHETNYCPRCQTGGRLLADRALSRLLKADWPRTIDELERRR